MVLQLLSSWLKLVTLLLHSELTVSNSWTGLGRWPQKQNGDWLTHTQRQRGSPANLSGSESPGRVEEREATAL